MKTLLYTCLLLATLVGCKTPDQPQPVTADNLTPKRKVEAMDRVQTKMAALNWTNPVEAHKHKQLVGMTKPA